MHYCFNSFNSFGFDSFEYRGGYGFNNRTTVNVNFNGPSSSAIRSYATMNLIGNVVGGIANLGAACILSNSSYMSAPVYGFGSNYYGGYNGCNYGFLGLSLSRYNQGYNSSPSYISGIGNYSCMPTYTNYTGQGGGFLIDSNYTTPMGRYGSQSGGFLIDSNYTSTINSRMASYSSGGGYLANSNYTTPVSSNSGYAGNLLSQTSFMSYTVGTNPNAPATPTKSKSDSSSNNNNSSNSSSKLKVPTTGTRAEKLQAIVGAPQSSGIAGNWTSNPSTYSNKRSIQYQRGNFDLSYWKDQGYDATAGQKLATSAANKCSYKADGNCVGYTRDSINEVYGTKFKTSGAGQDFGKNILTAPQLYGKFRKVSLDDVKAHGLPDGAVVLYEGKIFSSGKARQMGHGGIAYQNSVLSDVKMSADKGYEVWIPIHDANDMV